MTLAPGGFVWLLRHELRLALRGTATRSRWARLVPILLLAVIPAAGGIAAAFALRDVVGDPSSEALGLVGSAFAGLVLLMISTASIAVLRTFHDRHDLDLLLSAPLPPPRILAAKAAGVTVAVAAPFALFVAPLTVAAAVFGHPQWLGGLAMVAVAATVATAAAFAVTSTLFATVGPRRARVVVQLAAAVLGGTVFLLGQSANFAPRLAHRLLRAATGAWPPPLDWPARAAFGALLPLAALAILAAVSWWAATRIGARHLAASAETADRRIARSRPMRFGGGLARVLIVKEFRLIARDPELIAQIALRLIYVIPLAALVLRGGGHGAGIAASATAFAGLLASSLAWIAVCAEDASDLLASAPVARVAIVRAKLAAACLPSLVLVAIAAVAARAPWAAAVTVATGTVAAVTAALLQAWFGKVRPRAVFRRRQSGSFVLGVGEVVLAAAWSGTAALLTRGSPWALAPALFGTMIMAGAIEARPRDG